MCAALSSKLLNRDEDRDPQSTIPNGKSCMQPEIRAKQLRLRLFSLIASVWS